MVPIFLLFYLFTIEAATTTTTTKRISHFIEEESSYNQSHAFRTWLNDVLQSYDNRVRPFFGVKKLSISLGLKLIGISSISETDMSFSVEMFFHESWTDDRLQFHPGTFGNRYPVTLPLDSPNRLWTPDTSFLNALRSKTPELGSVSHLYSMMLFPNGTVGYSRRLSVTAQCQMDLTMYPFDRQACTLELSSYGWTNDDIVYEWMRKEIPIAGISLADFDAEYSRVKVITKKYAAGNFSVPTMCVLLARRSGFCFLQLFVPATAVVMSSWIALWHDNETQFTDLVSVILAIIFLSYSYNTVMPKVSYVKAMDIYLLACFIFVFCSLVKLAVVKYMRQVVHKRKERRSAAYAASAPAPIVVEEPLLVPTVESAEESKQWSEVDPCHMSDVDEEVEHVHEPTQLLVTSEDVATAVPFKVEPIIPLFNMPPQLLQSDPNQSISTGHRRSFTLRPRSWRRFQDQNRQRRVSEGGDGEKQKKLRRRVMSGAQQARRILHFRWPAAPHMIHLPSLHDNYWRCMKAFHLGSQLIFPLAFGAFAVFYFFIYPNVRTNQGSCD